MMRLFCLLVFLLMLACSSASKDGLQTEALVYLKEKDGNFDLYQSDVLGQWETRLTNQPGWDWSPQWVPELKQLAYYSRDTTGQFYWLKKAIEDTHLDSLPFSDLINPKLSPEGNAIYYLEEKSKYTNIKKVNLEGSQDEYLTNTKSYNGRFQLDHQGRQMAFISDRNGANQLYLMDLEKKTTKQLTTGQMVAKYSSFAPDGQQLAVCLAMPSSDPKWDIYIIHLSTGEMEQLTRTPYSEEEISWSLTGQKIAFHAHTVSDGDQIYTIDVADGKFTKITSGDHYHGEPVWVMIHQAPSTSVLLPFWSESLYNFFIGF